MALEEKAEVVRRVFEALARREVEAAVEWFDPGVEFDFTRSRGPGRGMYVGRSEVQKNYEDVLGTWTEWVVEPHDFVETDDDGVLFSVRGRMTGRDGIEVTVRAAWIWTIRDDRIVRATFFQTRKPLCRQQSRGSFR